MECVYLRPSFERPLLMTKFGLFGMDNIMCSSHRTQKTIYNEMYTGDWWWSIQVCLVTIRSWCHVVSKSGSVFSR
jgi:hypothetical protein